MNRQVQYDVVWFKMPAPERLRDTCRLMMYASTTGMGINLAFRDAIVAANHLVPVLRSGGDPGAVDGALARVQAEREPEVARSQLLQQRDTRGIGTWYAPILIGLAGFLGPKLGKYRWAQQAWLGQQRDLAFGSRDVKLAV